MGAEHGRCVSVLMPLMSHFPCDWRSGPRYAAQRQASVPFPAHLALEYAAGFGAVGDTEAAVRIAELKGVHAGGFRRINFSVNRNK